MDKIMIKGQEKLISDRDVYERVELSKIIPLDTPLVLFIEPSRSCNLKCIYCHHSLSRNKVKELNVINEGIMHFDLFKKIIDDIKMFPNKIKCVHITSRGEPLLNKKLPEMISYIKSTNITERVNLVTNGILLSPELNIDLIESGLDSIKISVQSITEDGYKNISGVKIDLEHFVENIRHFYEHNKNSDGRCKLYVKIADIFVGKEDISKFYEIFSDICDGVSIEHIYDIDDDVNLNLNKKEGDDKSAYNKPIKRVKVCPMPFYMLNIGFDGDAIPCCYYQMESFGNLKNMTILELWNGDKLKKFRCSLLRCDNSSDRNSSDRNSSDRNSSDRNSSIDNYCKRCNIPNYSTDEKDNIDDCVEQIIEKL